MDTLIATAQAEMGRLVQLGGLEGDPLRHPIQALSVHLDAVRLLTTALVDQKPQLTVETVSHLLTDAKTQAAADIARQAALRLPGCLDKLAGRELLKVGSWLAGAALAISVVCFGAGWWVRGETPKISWSCNNQQGGRFCGFWAIPPQ